MNMRFSHLDRAVASRWIANPAVQVVMMTGVTGFDGTSDAVTLLFVKVLDRFSKIFRAILFEEVATSSLQSRPI
jgi:molybdenum cofactor biosynthesis protein B